MEKLSTIDKQNLEQPRAELDRLPFELWRQQYSLRHQYVVTREVRGGGEGSLVRHTTCQNDGHFIPDTVSGKTGKCDCPWRRAHELDCRHEQSARVNNGEQPYCRETTSPRHFFLPTIPTSRRGMCVASTEELSCEETKHIVKADVSESNFSPTGLNSEDNQSESQLQNMEEHSKPPPAGYKESLMLGSPSQTGTEFGSKKDLVPRRRCPNVSFMQLNRAAMEVANQAAGGSNEVQNAILTHLTQLGEFIIPYTFNHTCSHPNHVVAGKLLKERSYHKEGAIIPSTCLALSSQLKNISTSTVPKANMPRTKDFNRVGRPPTHRFGSAKSKATRPPPRCTFCGGDDGTHSGKFCGNSSTCSLKMSYGLCLRLTRNDITTVGGRIQLIGTTSSQDKGIVCMTGMSQCMKIDGGLPTGTTHVVVRGYFISKEMIEYLVCTLLNSVGRPMVKPIGDITTSYNTVLIEKTSLVTQLGLGSLRNVFLKSSGQAVVCPQERYRYDCK